MSRNSTYATNTLIAIIAGVVGVLGVIMLRVLDKRMPIIRRKMVEKFQTEHFAIAVMAQNKEAFRRLSEM
jgi:capsular polysaccharide biosynthesis protein